MDAYRVAFNTWQEKTEWVQKDKRFDVLLPWGKHRADVLKEYIDHLEAKCAALAAELSSVLTDRDVILEDLDNTCFEIGMQRGEKYEAYPTPVVANHDAFLAEVRAQGVDELAELNLTLACHEANRSIAESWRESARFAKDHAAQLRKGVQS